MEVGCEAEEPFQDTIKYIVDECLSRVVLMLLEVPDCWSGFCWMEKYLNHRVYADIGMPSIILSRMKPPLFCDILGIH